MYEEYCIDIERMSISEDSGIFYNYGRNETTITTINSIYKTAKNYICVLCSDTKSLEFSIDNIYTFLKPDKNRILYILFDNFKGKNIENINNLLSKYYKQVKIKKLKDKHIFFEEKHAQWMVSDDKIFRLVTNPMQQAAWGSFNDQQKSIALREAFDKFFSDEYSESLF